MKLKETLKDVLAPAELEELRSGFDLIGDIAIIEIPDHLMKHRESIAQTLVKTHPRIKTVCRKTSERTGPYRLWQLDVISGSSTETVHTEHGCHFLLDVKKAYFSPRESTERQRIATQVKPKEKVLVMFSGIAPFPIIIAKRQPSAEIWGIELNPDACASAGQNVKKNKVADRVHLRCGDVTVKLRELPVKFDRILMPLPHEAHRFLPLAIHRLKKGGILHFYAIAPEEDLWTEAEQHLKAACETEQKKYKILHHQKVLPYGPRTFKICLDVKVG